MTLLYDSFIAGIQSFCRDLVEVADILEKTTENVSEQDLVDQNPTLKMLFEGLSLVESKLQYVFNKHGLQKMTPVGGRYDPYDHEIVCHVPAENVQPGTIAVVSLDGYKLHGRTIRHAHVGVAVETQE
ncbi:grpE protein homolog 2, mitochondrial [Protopterus annectens]|uniref:grpE protein homolog 2, mitochondrial n=1 Tax=Protopterus annectens TaxID=7888 RepID=UPI001CFAA808|nr:grpE protein homolog 2, mitochondrial [Protopterus annectens]